MHCIIGKPCNSTKPEGNDKKQFQLNKAVTQPLAPGLLQLITRFFSVNPHHAARSVSNIGKRKISRQDDKCISSRNINHIR